MKETDSHEFIGLNSLMFVLIVCICLFLSHFIKQYKISYISESGAAMLFGLFVGGILSNFTKEEITFVHFNPEIFFYILLPPIIFEAGFSLKRKQFFQNMSTILLFAVMGTIVSTLVVGLGLYGLKLVGFQTLNNVYECLLFGSLISAVDPVGTLAVLGKKELNTDPMLYSLIFGESVLNDAVAIVLYKTIEGVGSASDSEIVLTFEDHAVEIIGTFCGVSIASFLIGCAIALLCAAVFRNIDFHGDASLEFTIFILFAYGSYSVAEILEMSGIVSVFFCGILMGHYAWYNVSQICQISIFNATKAFAELAESFVYAYLGITAGISFDSRSSGYVWNIPLIIATSLLCLLGRALNIFPFAFLANCRRERPIPPNMQVMMWFAGLRGAIAFALALNVPATTPGQAVIVTTTLCIVFVTTIVCGGMTERMLSTLGLKAAQPSWDDGDAGNTLLNNGVKKHPEKCRTWDNAKYSGMHKIWRDLDDNLLKPWFGGDMRSSRQDTSVLVSSMADMVQNLPAVKHWHYSEPHNVGQHDSDSGNEQL